MWWREAISSKIYINTVQYVAWSQILFSTILHINTLDMLCYTYESVLLPINLSVINLGQFITKVLGICIKYNVLLQNSPRVSLRTTSEETLCISTEIAVHALGIRHFTPPVVKMAVNKFSILRVRYSFSRARVTIVASRNGSVTSSTIDCDVNITTWTNKWNTKSVCKNCIFIVRY